VRHSSSGGRVLAGEHERRKNRRFTTIRILIALLIALIGILILLNFYLLSAAL
jgi:hypothetical protein